MEVFSTGDPIQHLVSINTEVGASIPRLVNEFIPRIYRYLEKHGLGESASDIIQEAFLILLEDSQRKSILHIDRYLFGIIRNLRAQHYRRKQKNREELVSPKDIAERCQDYFDQDAVLPQEQEREDEQLEWLMTDQLKETPRKVLEMRFLQRMTYKEISEQLDKSEQTIRQIASRAMKKLQSPSYPNRGNSRKN